MLKEDNLVNYIIKNFLDEFKKEIYDICSKKVNEALKNKNSEKKIQKKKKYKYNRGARFEIYNCFRPKRTIYFFSTKSTKCAYTIN